jgi:integrase
MFKEARRLGNIQADPAAGIEPLKETPKRKSILTREEVRVLFTDKALVSVWGGNLPHFALNLLAATTGMRMGEIQGLQVQHVHQEHVAVVHSWARKYGLKEPKWQSAREIPIPRITSRYLQETIEQLEHKEPKTLVFSEDGRTPFTPASILLTLYQAFERIKITPEDRERRNITFHSWRHWFNSMLREKVPDYKLQKLTGHRTQEMTEHYTHLRLDDFQDVRALQEDFFRGGAKTQSGAKKPRIAKPRAK